MPIGNAEISQREPHHTGLMPRGTTRSKQTNDSLTEPQREHRSENHPENMRVKPQTPVCDVTIPDNTESQSPGGFGHVTGGRVWEGQPTVT